MSDSECDSGCDSGFVALRRRAMDLLARREHSRAELAAKLQDRFAEADPDAIESVLDKLAAENLQSDRRFAGEYLRMRMRRGFGWLHIRGELQTRGVADSIISELVRPDEEWLELAESLVDSRLAGQKDLTPGGREHQRLFRFLQGRGFSAETAHRSLRKAISRNPAASR